MSAQVWVGGIAATLTTCSFIPQVWRVWKTRHTQDISLLMYAFFTTGVALWLAYGLMIGAWPISKDRLLAYMEQVFVLKLRFG